MCFGRGKGEGNLLLQGCQIPPKSQPFIRPWPQEGTCCHMWKSNKKAMCNAQISGVPVPKLKPQGERTPHVRRSTLEPLEMKQLLLLLQERSKLNFCSCVEWNCKGKKVKSGRIKLPLRDLIAVSTQARTLEFLKNTSLIPTIVLFQSPSFLQLFI